jgi:tetratricopeptide (TPR) repeat protein
MSVISLLILVLIVATPSYPQSSTDRNVGTLLDQARDLEQKGSYADAAEVLKKIVVLQPDEYWARMRLARDYVRLGRLELARDQFKLARKIDPKQAEAYIEEGYADENAGAQALAAISFSELIAVDTASWAGYHHFGAHLSTVGRNEEAEHYFREALKRLDADPAPGPIARVHAIMWLGDVVRKQGRISEAAAIYNDGLSRSANLPGWRATFLDSLGQLSLAQGRSTEAEEYFKRGRASCRGEEFSIGCADVLFTLVDFYASRARKADAQAAADALIAFPAQEYIGTRLEGVGSFPEKFNQLGLACEKTGLDSEAQEAYRRVLSFSDLPRSSPQYQTAKDSLANLLRRKTLPDRADKAPGAGTPATPASSLGR